MIKELQALNSDFAKELTTSVKDRIDERRQPKLSTLLAYLNDPHFLDASKSWGRVLSYANKTAITTLAKEIYMRLFHEEQDEASNEGPQDSQEPVDSTGPTPPKRTRSQELRDHKSKKPDGTTISFTTSSTRVLNAIKTDMKSFEFTGTRPRMLEQV